VKQGKYKVARGLYSNTLGEPSGLTRKFIDYLFSREGQAIIAEKGFIPAQ
jgi:phosphate transport system substrate-binding protein